MTPLLLSISAMAALDMVIKLKEMIVESHKLGVSIPMIQTPSNHLAINVAFAEKSMICRSLVLLPKEKTCWFSMGRGPPFRFFQSCPFPPMARQKAATFFWLQTLAFYMARKFVATSLPSTPVSQNVFAGLPWLPKPVTSLMLLRLEIG